MKHGLRTAIEYLKDCDVELIPEVLHSLARIEVMVHTLSHSLRRAARGGNGEVLVSYHPDQSGVDIAYYRANPDWKAQERPKTSAKAVWYWFTLKTVPIASPMFHSLQDLKRDIHYTPGCKIWQGGYDSPILYEDK